MTKRANTVTVDEHDASSRALQRSGSSPNISAMKMAAHRHVAQNSSQSFYVEDDRLKSWSVNRGQHANDRYDIESPTRGRGSSKTITEKLEAVSETGWNAFETPPQSKKRSRSPIRKFFGEAWRANPSPKDELGMSMKAGLIEKTKKKIKGAIGEIVCLLKLN